MLFVLDEGKTGLLRLLETTYSGGIVESYEYFKGWPLVYFYRVPAGGPRSDLPPRGIRGIYRESLDPQTPPILTRVDPVLNFTFRNDFGLGDFKTLWVNWTGFLLAQKPGSYSILILGTDTSTAWVDGQCVVQLPNTREGVVNLKSGRHRIRIEFTKTSGVDTALSLYWKTPGSDFYQVIPFWQWGEGSSR